MKDQFDNILNTIENYKRKNRKWVRITPKLPENRRYLSQLNSPVSSRLESKQNSFGKLPEEITASMPGPIKLQSPGKYTLS